MKKTIFILSVSTLFLISCNSGNKSNQQGNSANSNKVTDTSNMPVRQQPAADTSIKDGKRITRYPNGIIKEISYYVAGRRHGECQSFDANGKMMSDCYFENGLSDGLCTVYYDNGQKQYEGNFSKGKPSGTWSFFDKTGKLTRTKQYGSNPNF